MIYNLFQNDRLLFTYVGKPSIKQLEYYFSNEYAKLLYNSGRFTIEQDMQYVHYKLQVSAYDIGDEYQGDISKFEKVKKMFRS